MKRTTRKTTGRTSATKNSRRSEPSRGDTHSDMSRHSRSDKGAASTGGDRADVVRRLDKLAAKLDRLSDDMRNSGLLLSALEGHAGSIVTTLGAHTSELSRLKRRLDRMELRELRTSETDKRKVRTRASDKGQGFEEPDFGEQSAHDATLEVFGLTPV